MIKYLKATKSPLFAASDDNKRKIELLWGDRVVLLSQRKQNGRYKVKARGVEGYVAEEDLVLAPYSLHRIFNLVV